jgi:hypothetical protein
MIIDFDVGDDTTGATRWCNGAMDAATHDTC